MRSYRKRRFHKKEEASILTKLAEKATIVSVFVSILSIIVAVSSLVVAVIAVGIQLHGFENIAAGIQAIQPQPQQQTHPLQIRAEILSTHSGEYLPEIEVASGSSGSVMVRAVITNVGEATDEVMIFSTFPRPLSIATSSAYVIDMQNPDGRQALTDDMFQPHGMALGSFEQGEQKTVTFALNIDRDSLVLGRNSIPISVSTRTAQVNIDGGICWTSGFATANATLNITN